MADRLISANALKELIDGGFDLDFDEVPETKRELLRMIDDQPTVDAEPVVRCKDCEFYNGEYHDCEIDILAKPNGYCSYGERREDGHTER